MFGYVKTHTPELKVSDYEYYRGAYCGLCRAMGKCTGQCSRMTLSYDFAFLALLRLALSGDEVSFSKRRCIAHPLRKRNMMDINPQLEYCAYAAALLTYHKLSDDLVDERGGKKAAAFMAKPFASKMRKRALRKGDKTELDGYIAEKLSELTEFERSGEASVDIPADIFGELLANIVEFGFEGNERRIAHNIGYHVGRWIYITDALDDLAEDAEKGRYNPFALVYGSALDERRSVLVSDALSNELCDAEGAFDLIDFGERKALENIIHNVFYLGMPRVAQKVLAGGNTSDDKDKGCRRKDNLKTDERSV